MYIFPILSVRSDSLGSLSSDRIHSFIDSEYPFSSSPSLPLIAMSILRTVSRRATPLVRNARVQHTHYPGCGCGGDCSDRICPGNGKAIQAIHVIQSVKRSGMEEATERVGWMTYDVPLAWDLFVACLFFDLIDRII